MKETTLKLWLTVNMVFSLTSGLLMIILNKMLKSIFGINEGWVFPIIGVGLISFSGYIFWVIKYHLKNKKWIYSICLMDLLWVLGSLFLIIIQPLSFTKMAYTLITIIALIVAFLGVQQYRYSGN